jgi:capsular polysaccharide transport system ATP-binding protein
MIRFQNLTKRFALRGQVKTVMENVNLTIPSGFSVALLGRNGAGKSTLLKMIAGTMDPTEGRIVSTGSISWPVGFAGSFHPELTGAQNTRFLARVYGVDTGALCDFVEDFAEVGKHFHMPLRTYSSGMKSRLAFGVSMGIRFDTYLVDEVTATGDASFRDKAKRVFRARMEAADAIVVSHSMHQVREYCDVGIVLEDGQVTYYDDINDAIAAHESNMKSGPARA